MKTCPACKTQYSDDTLSFCLQDGTPLVAGFASDTPTVVLGETETVAARKGDHINVPVGESGSNAWQQSQVTHVATMRPERQGSNTPIAVAATAVGMLLLVGVVGIAAWIYFRNSGQPPVQNSNNTANIPGGELNNGTFPTPQMSPFATPSSTTRPPATPLTNGTVNTLPPPTTGNDEQSRGEVSQRVYDWKSMLESRNFNAYMGNYADTVDYYRRQNASIGTVRADKARAFSLYSSMRVNVSNMNVSVGPTGETATAVFDKEWAFSGRDTSSGKVRSQLTFRKFGGRWLITGERDLKVYYTR